MKCIFGQSVELASIFLSSKTQKLKSMYWETVGQSDRNTKLTLCSMYTRNRRMCLDPGVWLVMDNHYMAAFDHLVLTIYSVVAVFSELTSKILCDLLFFFCFFFFLSSFRIWVSFFPSLSLQTTIYNINQSNKKQTFNDRKIINFYFNSFHFWNHFRMTWHRDTLTNRYFSYF